VNPEKKFWYEIKAFNLKNNCELSFTRVENTASWGTPDILGYNRNRNFFTIELKVTKTNKVRLLKLEACGPDQANADSQPSPVLC
jgi:hypothetical protein